MRSRKEIVDQVFARVAARGIAIDRDPEFLAIVDMWIEHRIDLVELRAMYGEMLRKRAKDRMTERSMLRSAEPTGKTEEELPSVSGDPKLDETYGR